MKEKLHYSLTILIFTVLLSSCASDDGENVFAEPQVTVMFSPGGLGDDGYNDQILRGVQHVILAQTEAVISFSSPESTENAETVFKRWLQEERPGRSLFVLAGSEYEELVTGCLSEVAALPQGKSILLFESANTKELPVTTFQLSMYGASYLAGRSVAFMGCSAPLAILANPNDLPVKWAVDGFEDGYGKAIDIKYLADDWRGYAMADELYIRMNDYAQTYDYFFGVAGGSNLGIYRYLREYPSQRGWTAGMDVDQSALTNKMSGSVIKRIDLLIQEYLNGWIDNKDMPAHQIYGLESGYVEWSIAPEYKEFFGTFVKDIWQEAIRKELEYENK